jgi:hypothetical protein
MTIETTTGGEIHTRDQLEKEMGRVILEATTELEDAQAFAKIATEETGRVELMAGSLVGMQIDTAVVTAMISLADMNGAMRQVSSARLTAAENRKAAAENVLRVLAASPQTQFHTN